MNQIEELRNPNQQSQNYETLYIYQINNHLKIPELSQTNTNKTKAINLAAEETKD